MASQDMILCIDIGSTSVKASQFYQADDGNLVLDQFAYSEYTAEDDDDMFDNMLSTLSDVLSENQFEAKLTYISVSGNNSFIRFVKVPSMTSDKNKIREIIAFEATNTIAAPMNEVVWDAQLIESSMKETASEIDAMLIIVKNEDAGRIIECVEAQGKEVKALEVAPTAGYNAARINTIGSTQCEMILNIGGKCSSLIFVDGNRFFIRIIPIAGNTITQQIAKEFNIPMSEAEEMKRRHGFVALGGAYEEPESEVAATVSKIVRNIMTRLHAEINRSINVYRASQHGTKPEKLYLSGGSSILAFTPRFFSEKLRIPVEYFNPFQIVALSDNINKDVLRDLAHLFSEMVGLALRHIGKPPIDINLIPESIRKQHAFRMKRPFFYVAAVSLLAYLGITCWSLTLQKMTIESKQQQFQGVVQGKKSMRKKVTSVNDQYKSEQAKFDSVTRMLEHRENWLSFLDQFQALVKKTPDIWFTKITLGDKPLVEQDTKKAAANTASADPYQGAVSAFGGSIDYYSQAAYQQEEPAKAAVTGMKWLNMEGYALGKNGKSTLTIDINDVSGTLETHLRESGIFADQPIDFVQSRSETFHFNIAKFQCSVELRQEINSPEYTKELREAVQPKEEKSKEKE